MALDLRVEGGWRRWHGGLGLTNEPGDHRVTDDKWLSPATPGSSFHHELLCFPNANINTSNNTDTNIKTNTNTKTIPTSLPIPTPTPIPTAIPADTNRNIKTNSSPATHNSSFP